MSEKSCGCACGGCGGKEASDLPARMLCVIPARFASTRLPEKMLADINGKPLVMWAYDNAVAADCFDDVLVATDDRRIFAAVEKHGGKAVMTSVDHQSGTDRVFEAATGTDATFVVNLQGDEPDVPAAMLREFTESLRTIGDRGILTVVTDASEADMSNPNAVKAVLGKGGQALYFSRSSIPYDRDGKGVKGFRHIGIYGFAVKTLSQFVNLEQGRLEKIEKLEQLRALENGIRIFCMHAQYDGRGIDTIEDLEMFRKAVADRLI